MEEATGFDYSLQLLGDAVVHGMVPVQSVGSVLVLTAQSGPGRIAIASGEGLRIVERLSTQLMAESHIAAAMVLREMCADLRCERALVEEGGVEVLRMMLILTLTLTQTLIGL